MSARLYSGSDTLRVEVVTVTKDAYDLIEDWITFHGALFGFENILILDNASTHPHVLTTYAKYKMLGVRVETRPQSFEAKADWWTAAAQASDADLVFPLDTDEFLVAPEAAGGSHEAVRRACRELADNDASSHFVIERYLYCHVTGAEPWYGAQQQALRPVKDIVTFRQARVCDKCFYRPGAVANVGTGNHLGSCLTRWGNCAIADKLALLHYHHTGERRRVERSWELVRARDIVEPGEAIELVIQKLQAYQGPSWQAADHLASHLAWKVALGPAACDSDVYALRDPRTHGLERGKEFELVEWPHANALTSILRTTDSPQIGSRS